jgi:hypothetical protein
MATFGQFPGVRVQTESGTVPTVTIGAEEKLVIFGQANYDASNEVAGDVASKSASANSPEQIQAPLEADRKFGSGSEIANAMKAAIQNGANRSFLYGVAVEQVSETGEDPTSQTGTLSNYAINEDTETITFDDDGTELDVEFRYNGAPSTPQDAETVYINPLTGEYAADSGPSASNFSVDYEWFDYESAFGDTEVSNIVNEDETGIYWALSDSDSVSSDLEGVVSPLRNDYQLVTGFCFAEPNDNEVTTGSPPPRGGADARYDTASYASANQSITAEYIYKVAPARLEDSQETIGGGLAGLYAGNPIRDAVYNEPVSGYQALEQSFDRTDEENMRNEDIIPVRDSATIRVKGNRSTAFGESDTVAPTFFARRITDRVILIAKQVGDDIIGRRRNQDTIDFARRALVAEMQDLVAEGLIQSGDADENGFSVDVYPDETDDTEINIDISFKPFGITKRVDETITVE